MGEQKGNDMAEQLNKGVEREYQEAMDRAYERAKGDTDTTKDPPSAAPKPSGT